jgi:hypothetical protein
MASNNHNRMATMTIAANRAIKMNITTISTTTKGATREPPRPDMAKKGMHASLLNNDLLATY